jgi:hypothetical protein
MFRRHVRENITEVVFEINAVFAAYEWTFIITGLIVSIGMALFTDAGQYTIIPLIVSAFFLLLKVIRRVYARI